ncbi:MAG: SAM-dependent DNA methyltransferase [Verrucomicrobia bacterium]|nr:SAM-dependent DNA methyltransferase [Verrucomicrobiota bacterium]
MNLATDKAKPAPRQSIAVVEAPVDDLERRRGLGQFFTSPEVAGFMWDLLEVIHGKRFSVNTRLIDPACGEGVFLRVAHERGGLPAKNLFGADIDATLAAGWQRDPLLRSAHIHLVNGLLDEPASGIEEGAFSIAAGNPPFSGTGLRNLLRLLDESESPRHEEQDFFEAASLKEESPSPRQPLSRQERVELDRLVRTLSQYSCWRLETEPEPDEEVETASAGAPTELFAAGALFDKRRPTASDYVRAAKLIAHWPPNRPLDPSQPDVRDAIRRLASTAIEVMFTERFVRLAKPGGLIAVIVPESIVASDRLGPFRRWLLGRMDLLATVGLPQKVFTDVGANARTTILFARRLVHDRPDGWFSPATLDQLPEDDTPIFLTAPLLDSPNWSLENYLNSVLASARRQRAEFWPNPQ